jgi:hypothetical protein
VHLESKLSLRIAEYDKVNPSTLDPSAQKKAKPQNPQSSNLPKKCDAPLTIIQSFFPTGGGGEEGRGGAGRV